VMRNQFALLEGVGLIVVGAATGGMIGVLVALPSGFAIWIGFLGFIVGGMASAVAYLAIWATLVASRRLPQPTRFGLAAVSGGLGVAACTLAAASTLGVEECWGLAGLSFAISLLLFLGLLFAREFAWRSHERGS